MMERLRGAVARVRERTSLVPRAALVMGPGVELDPGLLSHEVRVEVPELGAGVAVTLARIDGVPVAVLADPDASGATSVHDAGLRVRVLRLLGAEVLLLTTGCHPLDPNLGVGDLVLVEDHLNLLGDNPLVGPNLDKLGPRFPDMTEAYDPTLRGLAEETATGMGVRLGSGVFAALADPSLLSLEGYSRLRDLGADLVGPGVVPEVIVARHMGMRVLALLVVFADSVPADGPVVAGLLRGILTRLAHARG